MNRDLLFIVVPKHTSLQLGRYMASLGFEPKVLTTADFGESPAAFIHNYIHK